MRADDIHTGEGPVVTVIIACFNHAAFFRRALESVLDQSRPSVRVIITDDGSIDESVSVIGEHLGPVDMSADLIVDARRADGAAPLAVRTALGAGRRRAHAPLGAGPRRTATGS